MAWRSSGKALKPRAEAVGRNAFELLDPDGPEATHILTLSELANAAKATKHRRTPGPRHGVPTPRPQPSALDLLEPDHRNPPTSSVDSGSSQRKYLPTGRPTLSAEPLLPGRASQIDGFATAADLMSGPQSAGSDGIEFGPGRAEGGQGATGDKIAKLPN
jgi:hypothetical protein